MSSRKWILGVVVFVVSLVLASALLTKFVFHPRRPQILFVCDVRNLNCGPKPGLDLALESPDSFEYVFSNAFLLKGHVLVKQGLSIVSAGVHILGGECTNGADPRCNHFIDLMNGQLGQVIKPGGNAFSVVVPNQLFPGDNEIYFVVDIGGLQGQVIIMREVFWAAALARLHTRE